MNALTLNQVLALPVSDVAAMPAEALLQLKTSATDRLASAKSAAEHIERALHLKYAGRRRAPHRRLSRARWPGVPGPRRCGEGQPGPGPQRGQVRGRARPPRVRQGARPAAQAPAAGARPAGPSAAATPSAPPWAAARPAAAPAPAPAAQPPQQRAKVTGKPSWAQ